MGNLKILETHNFFSKYETAIAFGLLAVQYLFIAMFPNSQGSDIEKNYIYLWFFDIFSAIPIIILSYFSDKIRRVILVSILVIAFVVFFFEYGFNSVYFNTFIALFLANRFLLFNLSKEDRDHFVSSRGKRFFFGIHRDICRRYDGICFGQNRNHPPREIGRRRRCDVYLRESVTFC